MDPSTTLITFLLETDPSVHSVQLVGSWDNFSTWYTMKHDTRRGRGQWRGCHSFRSNSSGDECHTKKPMRTGGLKMGNTYYYYYEVDGSTETHDPAKPSTTACPYLPGQTVNTLFVPIEQISRLRSASVNSLRQESYMTMDPEARYITPVPQAETLVKPAVRRLGSASSLLHGRLPTRPESVGPSWKRFFGRKTASQDMERPSTAAHHGENVSSRAEDRITDSRPPSSLDGRRTRDISPASLRRFLVNETPLRTDSSTKDHPSLHILSLAEDEVDDDDDDDNFATSAVPETQVYGTRLSPPPFKRSACVNSRPQHIANSSSLTLTIKPSVKDEVTDGKQPDTLASICQLSKLDPSSALCNSSPTMSSTTFATPISPQSLADEPACFYDSNEDDDRLSSADGDHWSYRSLSNMPNHEVFKGYSLPRPSVDDKTLESSTHQIAGLRTSSLLTARDTDIPITRTNFLGGPIDTGLDDFVSELGLMVEVISNKRN